MKLNDIAVCDILLRRERGESVSSIASLYQVRVSTIYRRIEIYHKEKRLGAKKRSRVKKLPTSDIQRIKEFLERDPFSSNRAVIETLQINISLRTLRRYCKAMNLLQYRAPRKFYVSPVYCDERMTVARRRCSWSEDQWKRTVFTDESGLDNSGFQQLHVHRPRGRRFDPRYLYRAPNGTKRIYFSWVSSRGVGDLIIYDRMDSQFFCHEVVPVMIDKLREDFGNDDFLIVHDNAPFYTSHYTTVYLSRTGYDKYFISIPPYSPDMNIIEHLWAVLRQKVKRDCFPYGQSRGREFEQLVIRCWAETPINMVVNLYQSLPVRMRAIVEAEGLPTRY